MTKHLSQITVGDTVVRFDAPAEGKGASHQSAIEVEGTVSMPGCCPKDKAMQPIYMLSIKRIYAKTQTLFLTGDPFGD